MLLNEHVLHFCRKKASILRLRLHDITRNSFQALSQILLSRQQIEVRGFRSRLLIGENVL
jgi:hypothetical protein